jgi:Fe-S cluster biogenesis protein NfuA
MTDNKPRDSLAPRLPAELRQALDLVRPVLQQDGGDIELVDWTDDGCARVRLTGRCKGCPHAQKTLQNVVRRTLFKLVPELRRLEHVEEEA